MKNTSVKPTSQDRLLGLLIMTGFILMFLALPLGVALTLKYYEFHSDWTWAFIAGITMTVAAGVVGGLFLGIGTFIAKRK